VIFEMSIKWQRGVIGCPNVIYHRNNMNLDNTIIPRSGKNISIL
jgi:hypothetical protein